MSEIIDPYDGQGPDEFYDDANAADADLVVTIHVDTTAFDEAMRVLGVSAERYAAASAKAPEPREEQP